MIFRLCSYLGYAAALLFAAHPLHVEAVAQAVSQGELLVGLIAQPGKERRRKRFPSSAASW